MGGVEDLFAGWKGACPPRSPPQSRAGAPAGAGSPRTTAGGARARGHDGTAHRSRTGGACGTAAGDVSSAAVVAVVAVGGGGGGGTEALPR